MSKRPSNTDKSTIPDIELNTQLTPNQARLAKNYAQAILDPTNKKTKTQMGIDAGYSPVSADSTVPQTLKKPHVRRAISEYLDASGLSQPELAKMLKKAVDRGLQVDTKATVSDALRGIEQAMRLHDAFPAERKRVESLSIQAKVDATDTGELKESIQKLLDRLEGLEDMQERKQLEGEIE